jgi:hypothetical protein
MTFELEEQYGAQGWKDAHILRFDGDCIIQCYEHRTIVLPND